MKIAILMLYTESWQGIAGVSVPNAAEYCHRHHYDLKLEVYEKEFSGFEKLHHIKKLLEKYDAVWPLDCDTLITNHKIRLEDFLAEQDFYITKDYNGVNAGSFIIKKSNRYPKLIDFLISCQKYEHIYCEQDAIANYIKDDPSNGIKILPHPSINSYLYENYPDIPPQTHEQGQWEIGDFVLHLPGIGMERRMEILKSTPILK